MNVRKLNTEKDFQAFVREMEAEHICNISNLGHPSLYPAILVYHIWENSWDSKSFVETAYVFEEDFKQDGLSPNITNDR